ncbi:hypothetical protein [Amycolatopsis sp. NPDC004169]|uniref:hypothetical protein n=1 Tax=Amycolatopsis sp. NPDC004169 TaxID=3154453 RepID=UPI0033B7A856
MVIHLARYRLAGEIRWAAVADGDLSPLTGDYASSADLVGTAPTTGGGRRSTSETADRVDGAAVPRDHALPRPVPGRQVTS